MKLHPAALEEGGKVTKISIEKGVWEQLSPENSFINTLSIPAVTSVNTNLDYNTLGICASFGNDK